jgi:hypothetical protein
MESRGGDCVQLPRGTTAEISTMAAEKYDWRAKMKEAAETAEPPAKVEKYDWRSKIQEAAGIVEPPETTEKHDWRSKIKEAVGLARPSGHDEKASDWRFRRTITSAIRIVRAELDAQREKEAAEKAQLARARGKAVMVHGKVIMPLLNRLRDDFASHNSEVLPEWHVRSDSDADRFSGEAATSHVAADDATHYAIKAEASVTDLGEFVNLSVACSAVDPKSASASQSASLFEKKAKFPAVQMFDELGSRTWFHIQLAECVRLCTLTSLRQSTGRP